MFSLGKPLQVARLGLFQSRNWGKFQKKNASCCCRGKRVEARTHPHGDHNEVPKTEGFEQQEVFPRGSGGQKSTTTASEGLVSPEAPPLAFRQPCPHRAFPMRAWSLVSLPLLTRTPVPLGQGPTLRTSLDRSPVSSSSRWSLGLYHRSEGWGSVPSITCLT